MSHRVIFCRSGNTVEILCTSAPKFYEILRSDAQTIQLQKQTAQVCVHLMWQAELDLDLVGLEVSCLEVVVVWLCHLHPTGLEVVVVWLRQLQPHTQPGHSSSSSRRPHHHILPLLGVWRCKSYWRCQRCSKAWRDTVKVSFHPNIKQRNTSNLGSKYQTISKLQSKRGIHGPNRKTLNK